MSKERAKRRAAREAEERRLREKRERAGARRRRWRAFTAKFRLPARRTAMLIPGRSLGERVFIGAIAAALMLLIWTRVQELSTRIGLTILLILLLPVLAVLSFDRRGG
jgi:hypothetical protein